MTISRASNRKSHVLSPTEAILESISDGVFTVDMEWVVTCFNRAAEEITAVLRDAHGSVVGGAETFRDLSEVELLRRELEGKFRVGELSSRSPLMQRLFEILPAIAASPSTVLVLGETGTGKELVARTLHALSPRGQGPFIAVNCGALPEQDGRSKTTLQKLKHT